MTAVDRLRAAGYELPEPPVPQGGYVPVVVHGDVAYVAGQVSRTPDCVIRGPIDSGTPDAVIASAATACATRALSALHASVGLDRVERVLFLRGFVAAAPGFEQHSRVLDHVSSVLDAGFGATGGHARSAVGVAGLPGGGLLEIELVVSLRRGGEDD